MKKTTTINLPVGYHTFHANQVFNFQFNRWHSLGFARYEDMVEAGKKIHDFSDWKREMIALAETAESEGRLLNAAIYYRGAEFYILEKDPDKQRCYNKFIELFNKVTKNHEISRHKIPYQNTFLSTIQIPSVGTKKGTILMHGGFDSLIEEFYSMMQRFANHGYEVIGFEGPGQGSARRIYNLAWDQEWEKPTKAVLDHFKCEDVTLYGISMGGWLCLRAAAFEPRIKRVVASGHAYDYMKIPSVGSQWLMKLFFYFENFTNNALKKKMKKDLYHNWFANNAMYITKKKEPMEAMELLMQMTEENMHPDRITQDVLILSAAKDHFIPIKMHKKQLKVLTNAKSVSGRIFTSDEHAQNHCQIGNIGLAADVILKWIDEYS